MKTLISACALCVTDWTSAGILIELTHGSVYNELAGGSDLAGRFLSGYCPPPYFSGCSQAVWSREPFALVRNYDYHPSAYEGTLLFTRWHDTRVLAMSDGLWGVLDGLNEHGLAVSALLGGLMSTLGGTDAACVPVADGSFLLVAAEIAEEVWRWAQEAGDVGALVARLTPGGAA